MDQNDARLRHFVAIFCDHHFSACGCSLATGAGDARGPLHNLQYAEQDRAIFGQPHSIVR
jgi:hypothetical protein